MTQINANDPNMELDLARKLFWLMAHDFIFFSGWNEETLTWDDGIYPAIVCNDILVPGADAESLHIDELDKYILVCKKYIKLCPEYIWCIAKRSQRPWRKITEFSPEEMEALEFTCNLLGTTNPINNRLENDPIANREHNDDADEWLLNK